MVGHGGQLEGRIAIVTGGASGIGAAISRLFSREGAIVGIADINRAAATALLSDIRDEGGQAMLLDLNVAESDSVHAAVDGVVGRYGRLDILVNNAGIGSQTSGDEAGWWRLMRINVLGVAWGLREGVAAMRASGGGAIVNTGSQAALRSARHGVYGSSKAAVHALTRYAALAHAKDRVRVNAVLPGNIYTPIHDPRRHEAVVRLMQGDDQAFVRDPLSSGDDPATARADLIEAFRQIHPLGRLATVDDVADAALYLASPDAAAVTGNLTLANGGVMAGLLDDRLQQASWIDRDVSPAPPDGKIAVVSANPRTTQALAARFETGPLTVAVSPPSALETEHTLSTWLVGLGPLAGLVFATRPDPGGDLFSQAPADWAEELRSDLRLPWTLVPVVSHTLLPGAAISFVCDAAGVTGAGASPAFCATAAALAYLTEDIAESLRSRGIRVNTFVAERTSAPADPAAAQNGAPATMADVAELAYSVMRATTLTGLRLNLITSHPDERPNL